MPHCKNYKITMPIKYNVHYLNVTPNFRALPSYCIKSQTICQRSHTSKLLSLSSNRSSCRHSKHLSQSYSNIVWIWPQKVCGYFLKANIHWFKETCLESFKSLYMLGCILNHRLPGSPSPIYRNKHAPTFKENLQWLIFPADNAHNASSTLLRNS